MTRPNWILLCLGLPFFGGGATVGYIAASDIAESRAIRNWPEVPARILKSELRSNYGRRSTTYSVRAEYEYEYDGRRFLGSRVGIHTGSDNIGSFHQDIASELAGYKTRGEMFPARVNPLQPSETVLYPDLRYGLLAFMSVFVVLFGGAGLLMMVLAFTKAAANPQSKLAAPRKRQKARPLGRSG